MGKEMKKIEKSLRDLLKNWSFRYVLWLSFSLVSIIVTVAIGMFMNFQYSKRVDELMEEQLASSVSQASVPLYSHIRSMLKASDALYYNVIRSAHFPQDSVYNEFKLVCEINPETIESIALFDDHGNLLEKKNGLRLLFRKMKMSISLIQKYKIYTLPRIVLITG